MKINRDIIETRTFTAIAWEMIVNCPLAKDVRHSDNYYGVLASFADISATMDSEQLIDAFPVLVASLIAIDNDILSFDWQTVAQAIDVVQGKCQTYV